MEIWRLSLNLMSKKTLPQRIHSYENLGECSVDDKDAEVSADCEIVLSPEGTT